MWENWLEINLDRQVSVFNTKELEFNFTSVRRVLRG